jgi:hypothetical protein
MQNGCATLVLTTLFTICTTNVEPFDKHNDKWIRIDVAFAFSKKEQKG